MTKIEIELTDEQIEKLEKETGLDIRNFDDALTFKIALMVNKYLKSNPVKY